MRSHATTADDPRVSTPVSGNGQILSLESSGTGIDIRTLLPVGAPVEVRSRFDDRWTHGFSIAVVNRGAYQLRRLSDGSVLPAWFPAAMVRPDPAG